MDYKEEQAQEIEILQSIYPDELEVESDTSFVINILLDTASDRKHVITLGVEYPETYPEVAPELEVYKGEYQGNDDYEEEEESDSDNEDEKLVIIAETIDFDKEDFTQLRNTLIEEAEEQLGIPSIFALASTLKDQAEQLFERKLTKAQNEYDEALLAKEREEQKKFYGTKTTVESFSEWRLKFRKELKIDERIAERKRQIHKGKLTGKEIFEQGLAGDEDELAAGVEELSVN